MGPAKRDLSGVDWAQDRFANSTTLVAIVLCLPQVQAQVLSIVGGFMSARSQMSIHADQDRCSWEHSDDSATSGALRLSAKQIGAVLHDAFPLPDKGSFGALLSKIE